jgi:prepilin signal peptidase PulO-like enzyme (type II secretory pathway)
MHEQSMLLAAGYGIWVACIGRWMASRMEILLEHGIVVALRKETAKSVGSGAVAATLAALLMAVVAVAKEGSGLQVQTLILCGGAWIAAWVDGCCSLVPDIVTLPLLVGGLGVIPMLYPLAAPIALAGTLVGLIAGMAVRVFGAGGLGQGDVKLLAAFGSFIGPIALLEVFLEASLLMTVVLVMHRCLAGRPCHRVPFAPAISGALFFTLLRPCIMA